ncbi:MAG: histidine phosphatase family protein [Saprospiraceae bacterium]|nr:histidine phosphatase family protein [Saprospiraceae bacterium]
MKKDIFILRHGETDLNRMGIVQGSGVDPSLNDTGIGQSTAFFHKYREHPFELVITSGLKRSQETVKPFIERPLPWIQREEINEISWGDHEGRPSKPEMIQAYDRMIDAWAKGDLAAHLPNGESASQLITRIDRFLEELQNRPERHILVCTHGRALRCLITRIRNQSVSYMESVAHANTGLYHVSWDGRVFQIHLENDISHLNHG